MISLKRRHESDCLRNNFLYKVNKINSTARLGSTNIHKLTRRVKAEGENCEEMSD